MNSNNLNYLQEIVLNVLQKNPKAREDTFILIAEVVDFLDPFASNDLSFSDMMRNHETFNIPSFESITRARRKILETRPDLKPSVEIQKLLEEREEVFKDYSRYYTKKTVDMRG